MILSSIIYLTLFGAFCTAALISIFMPRWPSTLFGLAALVTARLSGFTSLTAGDLIFWAAATAVVVCLRLALPTTVSRSKAGLPFISGGALTATFVGMLFNTQAAIIIAAVAGALLGAVAFSNTAKGAPMDFPSRKFFNYTAAKGFPVIVTLAMVALALLNIITFFHA